MALVITTQNFQEEVLDSATPVLVDFWAVWCGPCKMVEPVVDELTAEYEGRVKVGKVNVDEQPELSQQFGVMSIPTLMVFKDGQPVEQLVGVHPKPVIEEKLTTHL